MTDQTEPKNPYLQSLKAQKAADAGVDAPEPVSTPEPSAPEPKPAAKKPAAPARQKK